MYLYIIFILFLLSSSIFAGEQYVRSDASGLNNGTDWNNAYNGINLSIHSESLDIENDFKKRITNERIFRNGNKKNYV